MKPLIFLLLIPLISVNLNCRCQSQEFNGTELLFASTDGIPIHADLYMTGKKNAPFVLLFHQAGYSRGEYRETGPWLNDLGFDCIAIDQRSGKTVNGVNNETFAEAEKEGKGTSYTDAFQDLESTLEYVKTNYHPETIIVVGSSYSASLAFVLASKYASDIDGIAAFSPGEYFSFAQKTIAYYADEVTCPVFITAAKNEKEDWQVIFENTSSESKTGFIPEGEGKHGSQALWTTNPGYEEYRKVFAEFLFQFLK